MKIKDIIYITLIVILFAGNIIYQHKVRKLEKEKEEELYDLIDTHFDIFELRSRSLDMKIDSLNIQYYYLEKKIDESIKINKQAKEQADRALSAYRDIVVTLPEY